MEWEQGKSEKKNKEREQRRKQTIQLERENVSKEACPTWRGRDITPSPPSPPHEVFCSQKTTIWLFQQNEQQSNNKKCMTLEHRAKKKQNNNNKKQQCRQTTEGENNDLTADDWIPKYHLSKI
jgi:hypothetical protein